jgi:formylglycine-generating enzyme required for sulfatase activity
MSVLKSNVEIEKLINGALLEMIKVEGGRFMMGGNYDEYEQPIHEVAMSDFYMGKYPITMSNFYLFYRKRVIRKKVVELG